VRHLHQHLPMWVVQVKANVLACSMSSMVGLVEGEEEHAIFLHSTEELGEPSRPSSSLWARRVECSSTDQSDPHIALTRTCLYSVGREGSGARVTCWNFWSSRRGAWLEGTFLQHLHTDLFL